MTPPRPTSEEILTPSNPTPADVATLLTRDYRAYAIPVATMHPDNFAADDDVREDLVDSLFTITDAATLKRLRPEASPDQVWDSPDDLADLEDSAWRDLFEGPREELAYRLVSAQHANGQRVSILLEREGAYITGFKVYGVLSDVLTRRLTALIC